MSTDIDITGVPTPARTLAALLDAHRKNEPIDWEAVAEQVELFEEATEDQIQEAREWIDVEFGLRDEIEVDAGALRSEGDGGTWVQAWVWVPGESDEEEEKG
jgi:hypothetical protein